LADKISIDDQIKGMESAISNARSYIKLVERYVAEGERPQEVLDDTRARLPVYEAILETLRFVQKNRDVIISVYRQKKP
jgi:hypothetical protein